VRQRVGRDVADVAEPLGMISSASNEMVSSMSDIAKGSPERSPPQDATFCKRHVRRP
jgi:hypothetical protein